jgi:hypothetical protein
VSFVELRVASPSVGRGDLARRIDRLSRAAHAFHRFAHHPLCESYADEVFRFGRRARVCRGCTLALLGAGLGAIAGAVLGDPRAAWAGTATAVGLGILASPRVAKSAAPSSRLPKWMTRLAPAFGLAFALASAARHPTSLSSLVCGAAAGVCGVALLVLYRRRGPDRSPCPRCPERTAPRTCSGFRAIVLRERAVMRKAGALIRGKA